MIDEAASKYAIESFSLAIDVWTLVFNVLLVIVGFMALGTWQKQSRSKFADEALNAIFEVDTAFTQCQSTYSALARLSDGKVSYKHSTQRMLGLWESKSESLRTLRVYAKKARVIYRDDRLGESLENISKKVEALSSSIYFLDVALKPGMLSALLSLEKNHDDLLSRLSEKELAAFKDDISRSEQYLSKYFKA